MADIELVIDIDESIYRHFMDNKYSRNDIIAVHTAIVNGSPLPKGHGDLIDRKELLKQPMNKANCPSNYVKIAPPIIKADKEE